MRLYVQLADFFPVNQKIFGTESKLLKNFNQLNHFSIAVDYRLFLLMPAYIIAFIAMLSCNKSDSILPF